MYTLVLNMICLFLLLTLSAFSQQDSVRMKLLSFIEKTEQFHSDYPDEKVYLHLDNTAYFLGEKLRFKAYVVESSFHQLSDRNKILHAELLSPEGNVVREQKLKIINGQTFGEFQLDTALNSGFFEVRAYTRTMLNFKDSISSFVLQYINRHKNSEEEEKKHVLDVYSYYYPPEAPGIFSRVVPVYEKPEEPGEYDKQYILSRKRLPYIGSNNSQNIPIELTFFPEGGHLVEGIISRIAFKASFGNGQHMKIKGVVINSRKDTVISFSTSHRNMGTFLLAPEKGESYKAIIRFNGKNYDFPLPKAESEGYVIQVVNQPDRPIKIGISHTKNATDTLGVAILCRGSVKLFKEICFSHKLQWNLKIEQYILPAGVNEIILFDRNGNAICERKIFIYPREKDKLQIKVHGKKEQYLPGEMIKLSFEIKQTDTVSSIHTFSVAVRDSAPPISTYCTNNIMTEILLASEIRGFIPDAAYYFEKEDPMRYNHLDILMMVQGWSRYPWERLSGKQPFKPAYLPEKRLEFSGLVKIFDPGLKPKANYYKPYVTGVTLQLEQDSTYFEGNGLTDNKGAFQFGLDSLEGEWKYFLKAKLLQKTNIKKEKNYDLRIPITLKYTSGIKKYSYYEDHFPAPNLPDILENKDTLYPIVHLEEALIQGKRRMIGCPSMGFRVQDIFEEALSQGFLDNQSPVFYLIGLFYIKNHLPYGFAKIKKAAPKTDQLNIISPFYRVDSVYIHTDYSIRKQYPTQRPDYYFMDDILLKKVINITTEQIPDYIFEFVPSSRKLPPLLGVRQGIFQGYTPAKEYYTEDFTHKPLPGKPDYRRVLYWNPMVKTDSSGQAEVTFYNNSKTTAITIDAETITENGEIGILHTK